MTTQFEDPSEFLEHFGVKGMKWGVRKDNYIGASAKTNKEARKDATEYAQAKMFYGQGAGTRRKLINATVAEKSKRDPSYAEAFNHHLARQNMSEHAQTARSQRSKIDRREVRTKRAGYLARRLTGEMGTQAAFTAAAVGGLAFINSPKGRAMAKTSYKKAKTFVDQNRNTDLTRYLSDFVKR